MKKRLLFLLLVTAVLTVFASAAEITGSAKINTTGMYLWRGSILYDGLAAQPELSVALNGFDITYWGSYDGMAGDVHRLEESDVWVSYEDELPFAEWVLINAGFVIYIYHYADPDEGSSVEIFGGASLDVPLEPYLTFYYDTVLGKGGYLEAGISHAVKIDPLELKGSLSAGYNFGQYEEDFMGEFRPSFTALLLNIGVSYDIAGSGLTIIPAFVGQLALADIYDSAATWSVVLSYEFSTGKGEEKKEEENKEEEKAEVKKAE